MQIDVHGIHAQIAGAHLADDGVEIGAIAIDIGPCGVGCGGNGDHVALEQPAGVGVGDHHRRDIRAPPITISAQPRGERGEIDPSISGGGDALHAIAREGRCGGVGAMGALGHQHDLARILLAIRLMSGADAQQAA